MGSALQKAITLILSADAELLNILSVTARMSIQSSLLALLLGVPLGIWLGARKFPGRNALVVLNRTLMGMPPVVCGLLFYMLFSGVGPLRHMKLLFTVKIMVMAQVVLITPIVVGNMETYVAGIAPAIRETAKGLGLSGGKTFLLMCGEAESRILDYTRRSGCAMILVTHSLQQARRVADEALFFYKGRLLESGPKEQVLYQPAQPETRRFLEFYGQ